MLILKYYGDMVLVITLMLESFEVSSLFEMIVNFNVFQMKKERFERKLPTVLASMFISRMSNFSRPFLIDTLTDTFLTSKIISGKKTNCVKILVSFNQDYSFHK